MEQALNGSRGAALAIFSRTIAGGFRRVLGGGGRPSILVPGQRPAGGVQGLEDVALRTLEILAAPIAIEDKFYEFWVVYQFEALAQFHSP